MELCLTDGPEGGIGIALGKDSWRDPELFFGANGSLVYLTSSSFLVP